MLAGDHLASSAAELLQDGRAGMWAGGGHFNEYVTGLDPEHSNTGGIECRRYDISGVSHKGGEYERGFPPLI